MDTEKKRIDADTGRDTVRRLHRTCTCRPAHAICKYRTKRFGLSRHERLNDAASKAARFNMYRCVPAINEIVEITHRAPRAADRFLATLVTESWSHMWRVFLFVVVKNSHTAYVRIANLFTRRYSYVACNARHNVTISHVTGLLLLLLLLTKITQLIKLLSVSHAECWPILVAVVLL